MTVPTSPEFETWIWYIESRLGFVLPKAQHQWLINAVNRTASELNLSTDELYAQVQNNKKLEQSLIDSVLIPETRFFRDVAVVNAVQSLFEAYQSNTPFVVMSLGCSTGQEVWSLAMALLHKRSQKRFEIWGVDASQSSLAVARKGSYSLTSQSQIPSEYDDFIDKRADGIHIRDTLKDYTHFWRCNIFDNAEMSELVRHIPKPNVIVCQNMLIYFRRFDQRDILDKLETLLANDGHLILGAGEAVGWQPKTLARVANSAINAWQKWS